MKGKFYNRRTRIHQILAAAMEKMLFSEFLVCEGVTEDENSLEVILELANCESVQQCQALQHDIHFQNLHSKYENFPRETMEGKKGGTAAYWAIYIYLVNRVYRALQHAVRTNGIDSYIETLPSILDVFFALNSPNYA